MGKSFKKKLDSEVKSDESNTDGHKNVTAVTTVQQLQETDTS